MPSFNFNKNGIAAVMYLELSAVALIPESER
jgi:hypothetical protein